MRLLNKKGLEAVFFDFGGVLAEEGFRNGLRAIADRNGLNPEKVEKSGFELIHDTGYVIGHAKEDAFWESLRSKMGVTGDNKMLREEILTRFILRRWLLEIIPRLKEAGLLLGILSDQTDWLDILNERENFYYLFDYIFNSFHIGKSKRDSTLFSDIALKIEVIPAKILFVDDHPGNIERAKEKGYNTILYTDRDGLMEGLEKYFTDLKEYGFSC